jgi:hypothetical protein
MENSPHPGSPPPPVEEQDSETIENHLEEYRVSTENLVPVQRKSDCSSTWCTLPSVYFLLVTNLMMVVMVFIIPMLCNKDKDNHQCMVEPFSLLIYCHTLYWFCHLVVDQYLKYHHRQGRLRGYLEFYIQTKNLRRSPFYISSFGNAVLLVTVTALHDYCDHSNEGINCEDKSTKIECLRGLISLECMIIAFMWLKYIMVVRKFKKDAAPPDVYRKAFIDSLLNPQPPREPQLPGQPYYPTDDRAEDEIDLVEIQSELLMYLCPTIGQERDMRRVITNEESPHAHRGPLSSEEDHEEV